MYFSAHRHTGDTLHAVLPRDIPKDGDSEADPLTSHHVALEGGDDGGDEVLDAGKAALAKSP